MSERRSLELEIEAFLKRWDLSASTFGRLAVNDGKFFTELKKGRRVWPETADRVRSFMRDYRADQVRRATAIVEAAAQ